MRVTDLLALPLVALWQQKSRTVLTTLGVVFGAFVLATSLSVHDGVQQTIVRESNRGDVLRRIDVHRAWNRSPSASAAKDIEVKGDMSESRRERIRLAIAAREARFAEPDPSALLTRETLDKLAALEHVETVEPDASQSGFAVLGEKSEQTQIDSAFPQHPAHVKRLVAGRFFDEPAERSAVISEFLLYRFGVVDEADVEQTLGRTIRIEIRSYQQGPGLALYLIKPNYAENSRAERTAVDKIMKSLPAVLDKLDLTPQELELLRQSLPGEPQPFPEPCVGEYTIVGVTREPSEAEEKERRWWESLGGSADVVLPYQTAAELYFRVPAQRDAGVQRATIFVDRVENVKGVFKNVGELGLQANAAIEVIERERMIWLLVFGGMTCIAAVAMAVAALGIANTMQMSVLERTREIGVMKAVGAAESQIQFMFLIEGALIGLSGGVLGLLMAWGASFPGDAWVRSTVERNMNVKLSESIFVFPAWLNLSVVLFAVLVTTLAAVYPAWRAARIDPVAALRHE
ncbi:MAG TPA: ABC transporter permease [Pirellulales bacterium]|nr:ABC transporter permease [Pirellulales bacterium]